MKHTLAILFICITSFLLADSFGGGGSSGGANLTAPVQANWTGWNTAGMTQAPTFGSNRWEFSTNAGTTDNLQGVATALPTVPYTKTFRIWPIINPRVPAGAGVGWADGAVGTPGKLGLCYIAAGGQGAATGQVTPGILIAGNWTNQTTISALITLSTGIITNASMGLAGPPVWFQLIDDNTNWSCKISYDGLNYLTMFTETRNTFLTATQLVVFGNGNGGAGNTTVTKVVFDSFL